MNNVWRELLGPTSPLVEQPWELRDALLRTDPHRKTEVIRGLCAEMSAGAQVVLDGLALYHQHVFQLAQKDLAGAMSTGEQSAKLLGGRAGDIRAFADVLLGLSRGWLMEDRYQEAFELLTDVLEPDAAMAILDLITAKERGVFRAWVERLWIRLLKRERDAALAANPDRDIPFHPRPPLLSRDKHSGG